MLSYSDYVEVHYSKLKEFIYIDQWQYIIYTMFSFLQFL